jgi:cobalt-zinc-cadmium resistance protein CzcA
MNNWIDFPLRNRAIFLTGILIAILAGFAAWQGLPIDAFPDVTNQQVMILTEVEGLGPLDI